jgi:hypothetical protein
MYIFWHPVSWGTDKSLLPAPRGVTGVCVTEMKFTGDSVLSIGLSDRDDRYYVAKQITVVPFRRLMCLEAQ